MLDILIVEDNKEIGTLLCDFLRKENYTVSVAQTGEKALELYEKYGAKVIVLDIMLPGMDGFAVCSKIRETSNTHILIASAKAEKNDKLKGLNLGADDYIEKPYDVDILIAKIKGILKRKYGQAEIVEGNILFPALKDIGYVRVPTPICIGTHICNLTQFCRLSGSRCQYSAHAYRPRW